MATQINVKDQVQNKSNLSKNVIFVIFATIFRYGLYVFSGIITSRILYPQDFGIISMAMTFSSLIDVFGRFGIDSFVISSNNISRENINSIYVLNIVIGIAITIIILMGANLVSIFYKTPEVKNILSFGAWSFLLNSLISIPRAILLKEMKQTIVSKLEIFQGLLNVSLIIIFALLGFRYLSYVIPLLITNFVIFIIYFFIGGIKVSKSFDLSIVKQSLFYSKSFLPKAILSFLVYSSDYIFVGYLLQAKILGYYFFGFEKALFVVSVLSSGLYCNMFFPLFSKLQEDKEALKSKFLTIVEKQNFVIYPILFIQIVMAKELITLLYGAKWSFSILTFQLISGYCFFRVTGFLINILFDAVGMPEQNLKYFQIITPACVIAFIIGAKTNGLVGVSIAAFLAHFLSTNLLFVRACKVFGWRVRELFSLQVKFIFPLIIELPFILYLKIHLEEASTPIYLIITLTGLTSFVAYLVLTKILFRESFNQFFMPLVEKVSEKRGKVRNIL